jgi:hypothetical protein
LTTLLDFDINIWRVEEFKGAACFARSSEKESSYLRVKLKMTFSIATLNDDDLSKFLVIISVRKKYCQRWNLSRVTCFWWKLKINSCTRKLKIRSVEESGGNRSRGEIFSAIKFTFTFKFIEWALFMIHLLFNDCTCWCWTLRIMNHVHSSFTVYFIYLIFLSRLLNYRTYS